MAIKIRFCTGDDLTSRAIRAWENDGWPSHCEAVLPDGCLLGAHFEGGVAVRPAGYDKGSVTKELVLEIADWQVSTWQAASEAKFYDFLKAQVGKPYDTVGILDLVFDRDWRKPDSWFCSELIAAALEGCGYFGKLSSVANHISPRDMLLLLSSHDTMVVGGSDATAEA